MTHRIVSAAQPSAEIRSCTVVDLAASLDKKNNNAPDCAFEA